MSQKNYFFSRPFIGTNRFPPHSFVPAPVLPSFHDLTSAQKRVSWKNFACCFFVQFRPNTIANQQRIVIRHYEGRWNATCHELSCLDTGHRGVKFVFQISTMQNDLRSDLVSVRDPAPSCDSICLQIVPSCDIRKTSQGDDLIRPRRPL